MKVNEARILVVDDEPVLRDYMGRWFEREGATVYLAGNGQEGIAMRGEHAIDLIVSDIRMPVLDGVGMLKAMRADGMHQPSVIFISGFNDYDERELFDLGAEALLGKPFRRKELMDAAANSLAERAEKWLVPVAAEPGQVTVTRRFESLAGAVEAGEIAFGRGGFSLRTEAALATGAVGLDLRFQAEAYVLAGSGIVRWVEPGEMQVGIEIVYLEEGSRARVVGLTANCTSFIPCSTAAQAAVALPHR